MPPIDLVRTLREQLEESQEQVMQLKAALTPPFMYPDEWRLTPSETILLSVLLSRPIASKAAFMAALYADPTERDPRNIDVLIWKLRQRLNPLGASIENVYGMGWRLDQDGKQRLSEKVKQVA